ncbi:unnamed protein product, partial [Discosporangium mesarthrocarpum]
MGIRCALACWFASAGDPALQHVEHPFRNLAAWLREVSPDLRPAESKAISRGITALSNSQEYIKSFDGMAHEVGGKIKGDTRTSDIEKLKQDAALYESASRLKEVRKLVGFLVEVEKGLNSAEIAEIAAETDEVARKFMENALLSPLPYPPPELKRETGNVTAAEGNWTSSTGHESSTEDSNGRLGAMDGGDSEPDGDNSTDPPAANTVSTGDRGVVEEQDRAGGNEGEGGKLIDRFAVELSGCKVQCSLMVDGRDERLVVGVGDDLNGAALLGILFEEPMAVQLASHGLMRETIFVNRGAFETACKMLEWAGPHLKASLGAGPFKDFNVHCVGHSF